MRICPRPAAGISLHFLGDEGILFSEPSQKIYLLNRAATFIWCCLDEHWVQGEIVTSLARTIGLTAISAERHLLELLAQWEELGLLDAKQNRPRVPVRQELSPNPHILRQDLNRRICAFRSERFYRLLATSFRVRYATEAQAEIAHPLLAHLEVPGPRGAADISVDVVPHRKRQLLLCRGRLLDWSSSLHQLAPTLKGVLISKAINNCQYFVYIHAGVVRPDQRCLLLPGAPGSGKTSITAVLIRSGFRYLSDEVALLEEEDEGLNVRPVPMSLCIKDSAVDLLKPYYPELGALRAHHRGDGKIVRYLNPPAEVLDSESGVLHPVGWIVFPRYQPGVQTTLLRLDPGEALRRLLNECQAVPAPIERSQIERMVGWIGKIPCFEMPMSSLVTGVRLLIDLCH